VTSQEKKNLLQKYFRGQCTSAEYEQVQVLLQRADEDAELSQLLDAISARTIRTEAGKAGHAKRISKPGNQFWRIAAALALLLVFSGLGYQWFRYNPEEMHQTAYGQTVMITLPDHSEVMLNGNSHIRYRKNWRNDAVREVWLEGEGFFKVVHTASHQKFIVHTADDLAVEVLGTTFTVAKRKSGTRVVLNEGKVRLNVTKVDTAAIVDLQPGDLVQVRAGTVEKRQVNAEAYSSWTAQVLTFQDTPLREVIALLEETYGLQIAVSDESLYHRRISGSTPVTKNLDLFFVGLEQTFDLNISRKGNHVLVEKRPLKTP
jgi:transmembrane sensor